MAIDNELKYQLVAGLCVNIISISYGAFCGWPSASFLELQAPNSPLETGPMSNQEAGWVGAMLCVGGFMGSIFFAWCAEKIGRKRCLLLTSVPSLLGWLIIPFATNPTQLTLSRFLGGFAGGGIFTVVPIYVTEISEDRVRGLLGTFLILTCNLGVLLAFVLGYYCTYSTVAWILSVLPITYILCFSFLPETPHHLMKRNKAVKAEKSLRYFRNIRRFSMDLPNNLRMELEKLKKHENADVDVELVLTWKDFSAHLTRKSLFIGISLMALNQFSGCFALINYTSTIFKESGSHLSPNVSAVVVGVIQMIGSYFASFLVERVGRKLLLFISSVGTGLGLVCLGGYSYLTALGFDLQGVAWIPVASFSFTIFIACWGVIPLPFVVLSEILPPKLRNVGSMICMSFLWMFAFFILKYLPVLSELFGMHGLMFGFSSCCFLGAAFVLIFVPETKGKSIEEILLSL